MAKASSSVHVEDHGSIARFRQAMTLGADELKARSKAETRKTGREVLLSQRESAIKTLPSEGGLARVIGGSRFTLTAMPGRIRLRARNTQYLERIDRGIVEHLTYGHRPLVMQRVLPGWFTRPGKAAGPVLRIRLTRVTDRVATSVRRTR